MNSHPLKRIYTDIVLPQLLIKLPIVNPVAAPRLSKIVVSVGFGSNNSDKKRVAEILKSMAILTGQLPVITKSKQAVSGFRLRKGMEIGCKVTLRGSRMYDFFMKLCNLSLPRVKDFRGLISTSFDGRGNYGFGLSEQYVFPEIDHDTVSFTHGMNISIVTTASSDDAAFLLLSLLGFPFKK